MTTADPRPFVEEDDPEEARQREEAADDVAFMRSFMRRWGAAQEEDALVWESVWDATTKH